MNEPGCLRQGSRTCFGQSRQGKIEVRNYYGEVYSVGDIQGVFVEATAAGCNSRHAGGYVARVQ